MRITIDTDERTLQFEQDGEAQRWDLYTAEAFEAISRQWVRVGWNLKYPYSFTWLGRPIIQLPEDMVRLQEVINRVQPDVILETGIAHGGSLLFNASLCKILGRGRVIGVDVEIRTQNREAIERHHLADYITMIEGSSTDPQIVSQVASHIRPGESTLVILDSNHSRQHVTGELEAYHSLVTGGSYIVATDGIMCDLSDVPRGKPEWRDDNPKSAAADFAARHPEFVLEDPPWPFNESSLTRGVTHWPGAWLRRR